MNLTQALDLTLQSLGFAVVGLIFWRAESALNIMAKECLFVVRLSFWLLVVGSVSVGMAIVQGWVPPPTVLLLLSGVALLLVTERRLGAILRIHTPITHERRARQ